MTKERIAVAGSEDEAAADAAMRIGALFDRLAPRLRGLALRLTDDVGEAEDLVQEAFLRVARRPRTLPEGASAEEAWLVRIVINLARDRHRRRAVRRRWLRSHPREQRATPAPAAAVEARATVARALSRLEPRRRAVVVLRYLEERSTAEIAGLLGMGRVTVRWHLAQARRELRGVLESSADSAMTGECDERS